MSTRRMLANRIWWAGRQAVDLYPYCVNVPIGCIDPPLADKFGINRSAALQHGIRTFAFKNKADRDMFCKEFKLDSVFDYKEA